jgi:hypothetical protein
VSTHKQLLPVAELFIGGTTGRQSSANITVGGLSCARKCYIFYFI